MCIFHFILQLYFSTAKASKHSWEHIPHSPDTTLPYTTRTVTILNVIVPILTGYKQCKRKSYYDCNWPQFTLCTWGPISLATGLRSRWQPCSDHAGNRAPITLAAELWSRLQLGSDHACNWALIALATGLRLRWKLGSDRIGNWAPTTLAPGLRSRWQLAPITLANTCGSLLFRISALRDTYSLSLKQRRFLLGSRTIHGLLLRIVPRVVAIKTVPKLHNPV